MYLLRDRGEVWLLPMMLTNKGDRFCHQFKGCAIAHILI
jgi:hypothetical protein